MSSYVNFYLKNCKEDFFTYMCSYSRSSYIYTLFSDVLGRKVNSNGYCEFLSKENLNTLIQESNDAIKSNELQMERTTEDIKNIASWNNSIEDKMDYYSTWTHLIERYKEKIEDYKFARSCFMFLLEMIEYNHNIEIYAGIDGSVPGDEEDN